MNAHLHITTQARTLSALITHTRPVEASLSGEKIKLSDTMVGLSQKNILPVPLMRYLNKLF